MKSIFIIIKLLHKLFEETHVVLGEKSEVFYAVFEVGNTFYTHSEGVSRKLFRVDTASLEHVRVDHTTTKYLYPPCVFAERATLAATDVARNIHLGTRFSEREVRRAKAYISLFAENLFGKIEQRLLEVGKLARRNGVPLPDAGARGRDRGQGLVRAGPSP